LRRSVAALFLLGVLAAVFWGYRTFFPGDETKIRRLLEKIAALASFPPQEPAVTRLSKANRLSDCFAPDVSIQLDLMGFDPVTINGRDELLQLILAARSTLSSATVQFLDIHVKVEPDRQSATALLVAKGRITGERDFIAPEFKVRLRKMDKRWLITHAESSRSLAVASPWPVLHRLSTAGRID
jgi:SnoaL-like domain